MAVYQTIRLYLLTVFLCCLLPFFFILKFLVHLYRYCSIENVRGKVVLITGASSGIGEQMTYEYARRGAYLVIVARREELLKTVAQKALKLGSPDVYPICADVVNVKDCKRSVDEAVRRFGRVDHVINNAGILSIFSIEDVDDVTTLKAVMDVNFWGSVYPIYFAIPHLKKNNGKVFVNASASVYVPPPRMSIYAASKAALVNFYEVMRIELGPEISITTAIFGYVDSDMTRGKHYSKLGKMEVDKATSSALINDLPVLSTGACAKAMVDVVCQNRRSVTEPKCLKALFFLKSICPEVIDWFYRTSFSRNK